MKVKTTVEMKFNHAYTGWKGLTVTDSDDNSVEFSMTEDDFFQVRDLFVSKCERIEKDRADEAAEQQRALEAKENEDD
jgi:hypothetical protein